MKRLFFILLSFFILVQISKAQENNNIYNPFAKHGYVPKIATLSQGKYNEFFDLDTIVQIGTVLFNTKSNKIVAFVERDTSYSEATLQPDVVSRWMSPDPLAKEYASFSPYNYTMDNPIIYFDPNGGIVVDKDGNPVYTSQGKFEPETGKDGVTRYYEQRIYYTNSGNKLYVKALIKKENADGINMDIQAKEQYICHGYTHLASIGHENDPDNSNSKVHFPSEFTMNENGKKTVYKNTETILNDDYTKLDISPKQAIDLAKSNKIIGIWLDKDGKAGHSAIVSPNAKDNYMFLSKNGETKFKPNIMYTMQKMGQWNGETLEFGGFYKYNGNVTLDINTNGGRTEMSSEEIKKAVTK